MPDVVHGKYNFWGGYNYFDFKGNKIRNGES